MCGGDKKAEQQRGVSWADLNQLFGTATSKAETLGAAGTAEKAAGLGDIGSAASYWKTLLSGDRAETAAAVAPVTTAATEAADAAKRQLAETGTARGGGTASAGLAIDEATRAQIDKLIAGVKPAAATNLGTLGATVAGIGGTDIAAMLNALGIGGYAAQAGGAQATEAKARADEAKAAMWAALIKGGMDIAGSVIPKPKPKSA